MLLLTIGASQVAADEDEDAAALDRTPRDCIGTNRIRSTEVIDDQTIVFEMRGGLYYSNILERECPGLANHDRFQYRTTGGQLCDIDTITVLEQWGGSFRSGFTCQLGGFHPITELEAEDLIAGPDEAAAIDNDVEVKEVDLPPGESEPAPPAESAPER
jgi:hypothetical protein